MDHMNVRAMIAPWPAGYAASKGLTNAQLESFANGMLEAYKERRRLQEQQQATEEQQTKQ